MLYIILKIIYYILHIIFYGIHYILYIIRKNILYHIYGQYGVSKTQGLAMSQCWTLRMTSYELICIVGCLPSRCLDTWHLFQHTFFTRCVKRIPYKKVNMGTCFLEGRFLKGWLNLSKIVCPENKDRLGKSKITLILQCCLSGNSLMAMSPTCFYFSLHGAKQKVKKFLAEAPFTRYTGMAGPGACDFTKKAPTACAKHAWSSDHGFTQQRLLCCQNCTWFMLPFSFFFSPQLQGLLRKICLKSIKGLHYSRQRMWRLATTLHTAVSWSWNILDASWVQPG